MNIFCDYWIDNRNVEECIENISIEIAINQLKRLDGKQYTEILLESLNTGLCISGGETGIYTIYYYDDNHNSYLLSKQIEDSGKTKLICGGYLAEFYNRNCFEINVIVSIIKDFFEGEDFFQKYSWELEEAIENEKRVEI